MAEDGADVFYCSMSVLLSFQLLSQLRLSGCRAGARLLRLGGGSHEFTRMSCGQVLHLENASASVELVPKKTEDAQCSAQKWQPGLRSCLQTSTACGAGNFALEPDSLPASLPPTDKGSEEGWRTLDTVELEFPVAFFHRSRPIYSFSKYWTSQFASVSSREGLL